MKRKLLLIVLGLFSGILFAEAILHIPFRFITALSQLPEDRPAFNTRIEANYSPEFGYEPKPHSRFLYNEMLDKEGFRGPDIPFLKKRGLLESYLLGIRSYREAQIHFRKHVNNNGNERGVGLAMTAHLSLRGDRHAALTAGSGDEAISLKLIGDDFHDVHHAHFFG